MRVIGCYFYTALLLCAVHRSNRNYKRKFYTAIMIGYRTIMNQNTFMNRCELISKTIKFSMPREILAKDTVNTIHKIISLCKPTQVYSMLRFPVRSKKTTVPQLLYQPKTKRTKRGLIYHGHQMYENLEMDIRCLPIPIFKYITTRYNFTMIRTEDQKNWR